jgi:hypothetical protein
MLKLIKKFIDVTHTESTDLVAVHLDVKLVRVTVAVTVFYHTLTVRVGLFL